MWGSQPFQGYLIYSLVCLSSSLCPSPFLSLLHSLSPILPHGLCLSPNAQSLHDEQVTIQVVFAATHIWSEEQSKIMKNGTIFASAAFSSLEGLWIRERIRAAVMVSAGWVNGKAHSHSCCINIECSAWLQQWSNHITHTIFTHVYLGEHNIKMFLDFTDSLKSHIWIIRRKNP